MAKSELSQESYGPEWSDVGPVLDVTEDKRGGATFDMSVGYWGISIRFSEGELGRLRNQINEILGD